jgi:hypothetical protein
MLLVLVLLFRVVLVLVVMEGSCIPLCNPIRCVLNCSVAELSAPTSESLPRCADGEYDDVTAEVLGTVCN